MLSAETYKDSAIDQIAQYCEAVTPADAMIIGDIIMNTLTQYKADIIDQISISCVSGIKDRLEQTLSLMRSA